MPATRTPPSSFSRRQWLQRSMASAAALSTPWWSAPSQGATPSVPGSDFLQPHKTVTIVVGGPAGGATDGVARVLAQELSQSLGREVIVDNKAGAGGTIGSKYVSQARSDGHTLLLGHIGTNVLSPLMQTPRPYDPVTGFTPIGQIGNTASVLVVPARSARHLQEALAQWKRKGSLSYASTGLGSGAHLLGHLLADATGTQGLHVPYRGSPFALQDLVGGRVDCMLATAGAIGSYVDAHKLQPLAIASKERSRYFPGLPTLREAGLPHVVNEGWFGLFASANTSSAIAQGLHAHLNLALQSPQAIRQLQGLMVDIAPSARQADYAQFIGREAAHWAQVVGQMGDALKAT